MTKINGITIMGLSNRELQCVLLALDGDSDKEIAKKLDVSKNSVKAFLSHAYQKLNISRMQHGPQTNPRCKLYMLANRPDSALRYLLEARLEGVAR